MKFFTYLLTVYMLLLSCMPCGDSSDCSEGEKVSVVLNDTDHNDHEDEENCTPFCVCACCAVPVFQAPVGVAVKTFTQRNQLNTSTEEDFFSASHGSIWQPPRV
ncbi:MAG: hypothetical protein EOP53_04355 [Sphingobacteriales bacterium]|nr:MAG: hypothetical protein EOP53_04355 [Sphingobacteriales bacterium]